MVVVDVVDDSLKTKIRSRQSTNIHNNIIVVKQIALQMIKLAQYTISQYTRRDNVNIYNLQKCVLNTGGGTPSASVRRYFDLT